MKICTNCTKKSGFITLAPVLMVSLFLVFILGISLSNSMLLLEQRLLGLMRLNASYESVRCVYWLSNTKSLIDKLKVNNLTLFNEATTTGISFENSTCTMSAINSVKVAGLNNSIKFYQNFNFPLLGVYLGPL